MEYELQSIASAIDFRGIENTLDCIIGKLESINYQLKKDDIKVYIAYDGTYTASYVNMGNVIYVKPVEWKFNLLKYFSDIAKGDAYYVELDTTDIKAVITKLNAVSFENIEF